MKKCHIQKLSCINSFILLLFLLFPTISKGQNEKEKVIHYVDSFSEYESIAQTTTPYKFKGNLTYLMDTRDYNSLGILIKASNMPNGFSLLGFTDIHGSQNEEINRFKLVRTFSEYRLSNNFIGKLIKVKNLHVQVEYNAITPIGKKLITFWFDAHYTT